LWWGNGSEAASASRGGTQAAALQAGGADLDPEVPVDLEDLGRHRVCLLKAQHVHAVAQHAIHLGGVHLRKVHHLRSARHGGDG
jgi:hypothetical protein